MGKNPDNRVQELIQEIDFDIYEKPAGDAYKFFVDHREDILQAHPHNESFNSQDLLDLLLIFHYYSESDNSYTEFDLSNLSINQMTNFVGNVLLELEEHYLRGGDESKRMPADGKVVFLNASRKTIDVTKIKNRRGENYYTRKTKFRRIKTAEIFETFVAISDHHDLVDELIDLNKRDEIPLPIHAWSEISDIVFNLIQLIYLDEFNKGQYERFIKRIAKSINFSEEQLLMMTMIKYNFRYGFGRSRKDPHVEDAAIEALLMKTEGFQEMDPMAAAENLTDFADELVALSGYLYSAIDLNESLLDIDERRQG